MIDINKRMYQKDETGKLVPMEIYSAEELSKKVYDSIKYYQDNYLRIVDYTKKKKDEIKAEILNEYEKENKRLKSQLHLSIVSLASEAELEAYNQFVKKHEQCRLKYKIDGGKMPYVIQHGHGLGCCTTVYCQVCGASKDITDSSVW